MDRRSRKEKRLRKLIENGKRLIDGLTMIQAIRRSRFRLIIRVGQRKAHQQRSIHVVHDRRVAEKVDVMCSEGDTVLSNTIEEGVTYRHTSTHCVKEVLSVYRVTKCVGFRCEVHLYPVVRATAVYWLLVSIRVKPRVRNYTTRTLR